MIKLLLVAALASGAWLWAAPAWAQPQAPAAVGIVADPCREVPGMPSSVSEFLALRAKARETGAPMPTASPDDAAAYMAWQKQLLLVDFPNLCRYADANKALPPPSPARIVFMGDSITEAWKDLRPGFFAGDRIDRGISGQTSPQMLGRFMQDVISLRPAIVHILAGTNDVAGNTGPTSLEAVQNNIRAMAELAEAHGIHVVLGTVLPARQYRGRPEIDPVSSIAALNDWIRRYAREHRIAVVDYYTVMDDGQHGLSAADSSDGVHPTDAGYAKMEAALERVLGPVRK
jgi:acyl-CoA thioesterase I